MVDAVTKNTTQDTGASVDNKSAIQSMIEAKLNIEHHQNEAEKNNLTSQAQLPQLEENFDKLAKENLDYANKNSTEMMQQYAQEFGEQFQIGSKMHCDNSNAVRDLYEKYKAKRGQTDDKEESSATCIMSLLMNNNDDEVLSFKSEEEFKQFLGELAEQGVSFQVTDANDKMECYSNGDGQLRHADNNAVIEPHEKLRSSTLSHDDFLKQEAYKVEQVEAATNTSKSIDMTPRPGR